MSRLLQTSALLALAGACTPAPPQPPPPDAPTPAALFEHALTENGLPLQDMIAAPLTTAGLQGNAALVSAVRADPWTEKLIHYLIGCALPDGTRVTLPADASGDELVFEGSAGLAPEWADGACEEGCQEWVSACLFARTNVYGLPVAIYLRGPQETLAWDGPELARQWPVREGGFYGNFFASPPRMYACAGDGWDPFYMTVRICTLPGSRCGLQVVGPCGDHDRETGASSAAQACEGTDQPEGGAYTGCHNLVGNPGAGGFPADSHLYTRVVTIFQRSSGFGGAVQEGPQCDALPLPDREVEPAAPGPLAGTRCDTDADCAPEGLSCNSGGPGGLCEAPCTGSQFAFEERAQCGGAGSTCLTQNPATPELSVCRRSCLPGAATGEAGACPSYQLCTGFWLSYSNGGDSPGCTPFCSEDAHCRVGEVCNSRVGACGLPMDADLDGTPDPAVDPGFLADGEPCTLPAPPGGGPCRGGCILPTADPYHGICGSFVNLAVTPDCPDDPAHIHPLSPAGRDNLGLCLFEECASDADCTAPLRCLAGPDQSRVCTMP